MEKIYHEMLKFVSKEQIYLIEPMSKYTSFKIGGPADIFVIIIYCDIIILGDEYV